MVIFGVFTSVKLIRSAVRKLTLERKGRNEEFEMAGVQLALFVILFTVSLGNFVQ